MSKVDCYWKELADRCEYSKDVPGIGILRLDNPVEISRLLKAMNCEGQFNEDLRMAFKAARKHGEAGLVTEYSSRHLEFDLGCLAVLNLRILAPNLVAGGASFFLFEPAAEERAKDLADGVVKGLREMILEDNDTFVVEETRNV